MLFCPSSIFQEELYTLLQESVVQVSKEQIEHYYSTWSNNFETIDSVSKFILEKTDISNEQNVPHNSSLLGIDLPIWFNEQEFGKSKIMLLGIDPLRNKKIFKEYKAIEESQVIIGTPYAIHDKRMRSGRSKNYWTFIENLLENNFVYVTDIFKTFFLINENSIIRSYNFYKTSNKYSNNLLRKEIELIKPDLIITLGAESYRNLLGLKNKPKLTKNIAPGTLEKFNNTTNVLPMVHLSGSTRKKSIIDFIEINNFKLNNNVLCY